MKSDKQRVQRCFAPSTLIAVDVDGTLVSKTGLLNQPLVDYCKAKRAEGYTLMLWSARGREYAQAMAQRYKVVDVFEVILSKPGYIIDDQGWDWIRHTHVIRYTT